MTTVTDTKYLQSDLANKTHIKRKNQILVEPEKKKPPYLATHTKQNHFFILKEE